jgi:hypothetical protein
MNQLEKLDLWLDKQFGNGWFENQFCDWIDMIEVSR